MRPIFIFAACMWIMAMPYKAFAHGTDYRLTGNNTVIAIEFFYSDKAPMQYAEVLVFSPENNEVEFQNGRTDQKGRFAFLAETPGDWQVKVNDGMGHAVNAVVNVTPGKPVPKTKTAGETSDVGVNDITQKKGVLFVEASKGVKLFFGLSILLNLFLGMYVWKRKK